MVAGSEATSKLELIMGREGLERLSASTVMVLGLGGATFMSSVCAARARKSTGKKCPKRSHSARSLRQCVGVPNIGGRSTTA